MNHFILLSEAAAVTSRYHLNRNAVLGTSYQDQNILPISETFSKAAFDALVSKTGCEHIRIYYGMNADM